MTELRLQCEKEWMECRKCELHKENIPVLGYGNIKAAYMFIGEAPGGQEAEKGEPFVGPAGSLLRKMISGVGIDAKDVFFDNICACRPTIENPETGNLKDRPPTKNEMETCFPRVEKAIYEVDPLLIIAVGDVAAKMLTKESSKITDMRGHIYEVKVTGVTREIKYPVMPIFHPSYLRRQMGRMKDNDSPWKKTYEDLQIAKLIVENWLKEMKDYNSMIAMEAHI